MRYWYLACIVIILFVGGTGVWFYSFGSIWTEPAAYQSHVSKIRFEFIGRESYLEVTDPEIVEYIMGRFIDVEAESGRDGQTACWVTIYDSTGFRRSTRFGRLYSNPWGVLLMTDREYHEQYEYFSFGQGIPARLSEAFMVFKGEYVAEPYWGRPPLQIYLDEGEEQLRMERP